MNKYPLDNTVSIYSFHDKAQNNYIFFSFYNQINTSNAEMHGHSSVYSHCQLSAFILIDWIIPLHNDKRNSTQLNGMLYYFRVKDRSISWSQAQNDLLTLAPVKVLQLCGQCGLKTSFVFYITCANSICSSWFILLH